jgi:hypothetical protein
MSSLTIHAAAAKSTFLFSKRWLIAVTPSTTSNNIFFRGESDWITYHTVVSTSADQMAIAPGYLQRAWQADGRNFYEYSMGSTHILDFFAYISARYQSAEGNLPRAERRRRTRG